MATVVAEMSSAVDLANDAEIKAFVANFDHHSPVFRERHRDILRYMLAHAPVVRTEAHGGFWVFTRYDDVCRIAKDDEAFSSEDGIIIPKSRGGGVHLPIDVDPPASLGYRLPLNQMLSPGKMKALKPELRALADRLIADKKASGGMDVVLDLAQPLAGIITMRLLGVDEQDWYAYADPIHNATFGNGSEAEMVAGMIAFHRRVAEDVRNPEIARAGGMIQKLHEHEFKGRRFTIEEIESMVNLLYIGGLDTAQAAVGTFTAHLGRDHGLRRRLVDDPSLLPKAIEEMLRVMAPQQALSRTAMRDVEVGGVKVSKGDKVLMVWSAANFDESRFACPFSLDIERTDNRHLTFGVGAHTCLGAPLARVEIEAALEALLAAAPNYSLVEDGIKFATDVGVIFGYDHLPIRF